jgi:hypothetical protein
MVLEPKAPLPSARGQPAWDGKNRANRLAVLPEAEKSPEEYCRIKHHKELVGSASQSIAWLRRTLLSHHFVDHLPIVQQRAHAIGRYIDDFPALVGLAHVKLEV